jgi:hypothetical protein
MNHTAPPTPVAVEHVAQAIRLVRGQKVLLDTDLALLYAVSTKALLQAVKRNLERFPSDFMLQLTDFEWESLRSQFVTLEIGRGRHRKYLPFAFTEQGVAMLSSVLRSQHAVAVNIQIMRAFVRMREILASNRELAQKLDELERKLQTHDQAITGILNAIRELAKTPTSERRPIGFTADI